MRRHQTRSAAGADGTGRGPNAIAVLAAAWTVVTVAALDGCRTAGETAAPAGDDPPTLAQTMADQPSALVSRLTGNDNGLELRKWLIDDAPDRIAVAMARYGRGDVLPPDADRRFRRNGLRFVRVALTDLEPLLQELGGPSVNVQGWHGQVLQWRVIHEVTLGSEPQTLAVDGRFRRFEGGQVALLARCWTVEMEDGPHLQLELVPEYRQHERRQADLRRLLERGDERLPAADRIESMAVDVSLEAGDAYLLTFEAPDADWTEQGHDAPGEPSAGGTGVGPETLAPPTLGQRMLWSDTGRAVRGIMVFVPRIPQELFPAELSVRGGARDTR